MLTVSVKAIGYSGGYSGTAEIYSGLVRAKGFEPLTAGV